MPRVLDTLGMLDYYNSNCRWCEKVMEAESDFRKIVNFGNDYLITCKEGHVVFDSDQ